MRRISGKKSLWWSVGVTAAFIQSGVAFAACDTATISGDCTDVVIPSVGNVDYIIANGAQLSNTSDWGKALLINGEIGSITNNGEVAADHWSSQAINIASSAIVNGNIVNNGLITTVGNYGYGIAISYGATVRGTITNSASGTIIGENNGGSLYIEGVNVSAINNLGLLKTTSTGWAPLALWTANVGVLKNSGNIISESTNSAIALVDGAHVGSFINTGRVSAENSGLIFEALWLAGDFGNGNPTIGTLTNMGTIVSGNHLADIYNAGTISTLNNYQGATGSGATSLSYRGNLPTNYNMIVHGDRYGQLNVLNYSGTMAFGIFGGDAANSIAASQLQSRVYQNVVTGVDQAAYRNSFTNGSAFGAYDGLVWKLTNATYRGGQATAWDLRVLNIGADLAEPQRILLENRQLAVRNALDYDCNQFGAHDLCVMAQARYSEFGHSGEAGGIVAIAKRVSPHVRLGAFLDERVYDEAFAGVNMAQGMPMIGAFAGYLAREDGIGLQARASAAFEQGKAHITRDNIVGTAAQASGKADVDSFGVDGRIGWGLKLNSQNVLTPYVGVRYLEAKRGAYVEASQSGALPDPMSFADYRERRSTGSIGADVRGAVGARARFHIGGGAEYDFSNKRDVFRYSSAIFGGLTYDGLAKPRDTRLFGAAGLDYSFGGNKALTLDGNVRQMDYGNRAAYSVMAGIGIAFGSGAPKASASITPPTPPAPPPPPPAPPVSTEVAAPAPVCNKGPFIVYFDWNKADITPEAAAVLDTALSAYGNCNNAKILLAGYADRSGQASYNLGLSQRRASAVRAYFSGHGVVDGVFASENYGEDKPRLPTDEGVREMQNRRVEITFKSDGEE